MPLPFSGVLKLCVCELLWEQLPCESRGAFGRADAKYERHERTKHGEQETCVQVERREVHKVQAARDTDAEDRIEEKCKEKLFVRHG